MNQSELDQIVALAEATSEKVANSALKEPTYKIVLAELLRQKAGGPVESNTPRNNQQAGSQPGSGPKPGTRANTPAAKVAAWVGTDEANLSDIFEFGDTTLSVHLPHGALPGKAADAQRLLARIKLSAEKIGYDSDDVPAKDLIAIFDDHNCKDGNVAKNLKASEHIISKGGKGTMKTYRLRYTGMTVALAEIRNALSISA